MSWVSGLGAVASLVTGGASSVWKWIALALGVVLLLATVAGVSAWRGYHAGYDKAEAEGLAKLHQVEAAFADARTRQAQVQARAEAEARQRLEAATARAADIERAYLATKRNLSAARREITNWRITDAARDAVPDPAGRCRFGPEWVRLYNEALGLDRARSGDGGDAVPAPAPGAAGDAGAAGPADAGVLPGGTAVTPEDILAHARDYGTWCRGLEAQSRGLIEWAEEMQP